MLFRSLPALAEGKIVLCDRFIDSSLAYQGIGRGIGMDEVLQINEFAIENHMPDATIFLSVSLETGWKRVSQRGQLDRLDQESREFHQRVAEGYEQVKARFAQRMIVIDAEADMETVFAQALHHTEEIINKYDKTTACS